MTTSLHEISLALSLSSPSLSLPLFLHPQPHFHSFLLPSFSYTRLDYFFSPIQLQTLKSSTQPFKRDIHTELILTKLTLLGFLPLCHKKSSVSFVTHTLDRLGVYILRKQINDELKKHQLKHWCEEGLVMCRLPPLGLVVSSILSKCTLFSTRRVSHILNLKCMGWLISSQTCNLLLAVFQTESLTK